MLSLLRQVPRRSRVVTDPQASDAGFTLIEVIVAMFLFALVAMMVSTSLIVINKTTSTSVVHQTATNLAQTQVDLARTTTDTTEKFAALTDIPASSPIVKTVAGRNYYITQHVTWLGSSNGATTQCSSGSGAFIGKTLTVTVTWDGMGSAEPVHLNSIISPASRLGSQSTGAILVTVTGANGQAMPGITVTAKPSTVPNGATTVPGGAQVTDAAGCAFLQNVTPGNYDVAVAKSTSGQPYIDNTQVLSPVDQGQVVLVSNSTTVAFQYDQSGSFPVAFTPPTGVSTSGTTVLLPSGAPIASFENTYGIFAPPQASASGASVSYNAHPYSAGYTIIGGNLGGLTSTTTVTSAAKCDDVDPGEWPTTQDASGNWWGAPPAASPVAANPGDTTRNADGTPLTQSVPMGAIALTYSYPYSGSNTKSVTITSASSPLSSDDPGCATGTGYTVTLTKNSPATVLLPFGTWVVSTPSYVTASLPAGSSALDKSSATSSSFTVQLDPRVAVAAPAATS